MLQAPDPDVRLFANPVSFVAVLLYKVEPATFPAFEAADGAGGEWARFFACGDGYAGSELWRASGTGVPRYLVIDRWSSEAAYEPFLSAHADEYRRRSAAPSDCTSASTRWAATGAPEPHAQETSPA